MDPTAPDNNDQNPQNPDEGTPPSPIQPGQFVITSEENLPGAASQPQTPAATSPQPDVNTAPTPQPADGFTANTYPDAGFQAQGPTPPPGQPDPTPFSPPGAPTQSAPQDPGSKGSMIKMVGIAAGAISLIAIIAALVWFFILRDKETEEIITTVPDETLEEASPTPSQVPGFGELPDSTEQAAPVESPPAAPGSEVPQATNPPIQ